MSTEQPKKKHRGGMPAYKPTEQERRCVAIMSGMGVPTALIRAAIGGRGKTGALSKDAFWKHFRKELEGGSGEMHGLVASKFRRAVEQEKPWAILAALRNLAGYKWDQYSKATVPAFANNDDDGDPVIKIKFVYPDAQPAAIDVTSAPQPTAYAADAPADYSKPALPAPPERIKTEFGIIEHRGLTYQDQMGGSDPPSAFDRGGPRDWMK
jgi:hypothetical protein